MGSKKLSEIIAKVRSNLDEVGVVSGNYWDDNSEIIPSINEAKDELWQIINQADQDFFISTVTPAITILTDVREYALPADFHELRTIRIVEPGFQDMIFRGADIASPEFRYFTRTDLAIGAIEEILFDVIGEKTLIVVPKVTQPMLTEIRYIRKLPDFLPSPTDPTTQTTELPDQHWKFLTAYATADLLMKLGGNYQDIWWAKVKGMTPGVVQDVKRRQTQDAEFVEEF